MIGRDEVVADDFVHAAKEKKESYKSLLRLAKDASVISFDVGDGIGRRNQDGELDSSAPVRSDKRKECETWISRIVCSYPCFSSRPELSFPFVFTGILVTCE